jgi:hypothetical protein
VYEPVRAYELYEIHVEAVATVSIHRRPSQDLQEKHVLAQNSKNPVPIPSAFWCQYLTERWIWLIKSILASIKDAEDKRETVPTHPATKRGMLVPFHGLSLVSNADQDLGLLSSLHLDTQSMPDFPGGDAY